MSKRQKPQKRARTPLATQSRRQHERTPLLNVRLPKALYTSLQGAAKADHRTLADWLRLNLPRLLVKSRVTQILHADGKQDDWTPTGDRVHVTVGPDIDMRPGAVWVPCEECGKPEFEHRLGALGHEFTEANNGR